MKAANFAKISTVAAIAALALSVAPTAKAQDKGCSNTSLQGTYAQRYTGFAVSATSVIPIANVAALTFDGRGGVTAAGAGNQNGNVGKVAQTGTYTVNPDCTGSYAVTGAAGFTSHFFFVVGDDGNEIQAICTDPQAVFSGTARRLFQGKAI